jgi:hypothetical protein
MGAFLMLHICRDQVGSLLRSSLTLNVHHELLWIFLGASKPYSATKITGGFANIVDFFIVNSSYKRS